MFHDDIVAYIQLFANTITVLFLQKEILTCSILFNAFDRASFRSFGCNTLLS